MYELYKQGMLDQNTPEIDIPKLWLYTEIFNNELNYSFKVPDNDTCDKCDRYLVQLKQSTPEERMVVQREYDQHLTESSDRYALKRQDKSNWKVNKKHKVLTVDLEKCLPTPALTNAQSFYSLKLWTFNYTIKDVSKNHTTCCMWDESVAGKGGNEMASCLLKWALVNVGKEVEEITIWSDNCPSQNRNINSVLGYFTILRQIPTLKVINHKYLLRGHTHLEVDSDHSLIERARKRIPNHDSIRLATAGAKF
ncbi:unnamed protein product [Acanthoscelides obtectus]|uniref:DUF7869 domain-containing protein n=1 Tax=Acanthoscelides obtectus TaxID=200917 RepID=A0A9P0KEA8_ACAOB|nr:unnamed protein product [Acanthoscelides obtectus]CAK1661612.1 hypothetical protein AOBTE_LOCUS22718 [Acanthoscelides obtectus]